MGKRETASAGNVEARFWRLPGNQILDHKASCTLSPWCARVYLPDRTVIFSGRTRTEAMQKALDELERRR